LGAADSKVDLECKTELDCRAVFKPGEESDKSTKCRRWCTNWCAHVGAGGHKADWVCKLVRLVWVCKLVINVNKQLVVLNWAAAGQQGRLGVQTDLGGLSAVFSRARKATVNPVYNFAVKLKKIFSVHN